MCFRCFCGYVLQRHTPSETCTYTHATSHVVVSCVLLSTHFHSCSFNLARSEDSAGCFTGSEIFFQKLLVARNIESTVAEKLKSAVTSGCNSPPGKLVIWVLFVCKICLQASSYTQLFFNWQYF